MFCLPVIVLFCQFDLIKTVYIRELAKATPTILYQIFGIVVDDFSIVLFV